MLLVSTTIQLLFPDLSADQHSLLVDRWHQWDTLLIESLQLPSFEDRCYQGKTILGQTSSSISAWEAHERFWKASLAPPIPVVIYETHALWIQNLFHRNQAYVDAWSNLLHVVTQLDDDSPTCADTKEETNVWQMWITIVRACAHLWNMMLQSALEGRSYGSTESSVFVPLSRQDVPVRVSMTSWKRWVTQTWCVWTGTQTVESTLGQKWVLTTWGAPDLRSDDAFQRAPVQTRFAAVEWKEGRPVAQEALVIQNRNTHREDVQLLTHLLDLPVSSSSSSSSSSTSTSASDLGRNASASSSTLQRSRHAVLERFVGTHGADMEWGIQDTDIELETFAASRLHVSICLPCPSLLVGKRLAWYLLGDDIRTDLTCTRLVCARPWVHRSRGDRPWIRHVPKVNVLPPHVALRQVSDICLWLVYLSLPAFGDLPPSSTQWKRTSSVHDCLPPFQTESGKMEDVQAWLQDPVINVVVGPLCQALQSDLKSWSPVAQNALIRTVVRLWYHLVKQVKHQPLPTPIASSQSPSENPWWVQWCENEHRQPSPHRCMWEGKCVYDEWEARMLPCEWKQTRDMWERWCEHYTSPSAPLPSMYAPLFALCTLMMQTL